MERKIGETFEFEGKKINVTAASNGECDGCILDGKCTSTNKAIVGKCEGENRKDGTSVKFVEVQEVQELNLCEILKDCPNGELFWSPLLGDVKLYDIDEEAKTIDVTTKDLATWEINADGTITIDDITSEVIMLYPSREQRDWTKVKYEKKKEKFDLKTLNAFDKVVVRNIQNTTWHIEYFSHIDERCKPYPFFCLGDNFAYCIPYNDDTKHLVGTTEEAPEYYRYWED